MGNYYSTVEKYAQILGDDLEALKHMSYEDRMEYRDHLINAIKNGPLTITAKDNKELEKDVTTFINNIIHSS